MATKPDCNGLPKEKAALATFSELCTENNLLNRPDGLQDGDANFAINDETTLLYAPHPHRPQWPPTNFPVASCARAVTTPTPPSSNTSRPPASAGTSKP